MYSCYIDQCHPPTHFIPNLRRGRYIYKVKAFVRLSQILVTLRGAKGLVRELRFFPPVCARGRTPLRSVQNDVFFVFRQPQEAEKASAAPIFPSKPYSRSLHEYYLIV